MTNRVKIFLNIVKITETLFIVMGVSLAVLFWMSSLFGFFCFNRLELTILSVIFTGIRITLKILDRLQPPSLSVKRLLILTFVNWFLMITIGLIVYITSVKDDSALDSDLSTWLLWSMSLINISFEWLTGLSFTNIYFRGGKMLITGRDIDNQSKNNNILNKITLNKSNSNGSIDLNKQGSGSVHGSDKSLSSSSSVNSSDLSGSSKSSGSRIIKGNNSDSSSNSTQPSSNISYGWTLWSYTSSNRRDTELRGNMPGMNYTLGSDYSTTSFKSSISYPDEFKYIKHRPSFYEYLRDRVVLNRPGMFDRVAINTWDSVKVQDLKLEYNQRLEDSERSLRDCLNREVQRNVLERNELLGWARIILKEINNRRITLIYDVDNKSSSSSEGSTRSIPRDFDLEEKMKPFLSRFFIDKRNSSILEDDGLKDWLTKSKRKWEMDKLPDILTVLKDASNKELLENQLSQPKPSNNSLYKELLEDELSQPGPSNRNLRISKSQETIPWKDENEENSNLFKIDKSRADTPESSDSEDYVNGPKKGKGKAKR